jgi:hypothetical protein
MALHALPWMLLLLATTTTWADPPLVAIPDSRAPIRGGLPLGPPDRSEPAPGAPAVEPPNRNPPSTKAPSSIPVLPPKRDFSCPREFATLRLIPERLTRLANEPAVKGPTTGMKAAVGLYATAAGAVGANALDERWQQRVKERDEVAKAATRRQEEEAAAHKPAYILRTKEQLIQDAQAALRRWKQTGKLDLELGAFLLETELVDHPDRLDEAVPDQLQLHREVIQGAAEIAHSNLAPFDKIKALMAQLKPYTVNYCKANALLDDFYRNICGNCVSNTKLITSAILDGKVPLPEGYELGAQLFNNHVQAVLVDKAHGKVIDLLTGDTWDKAKAPVYKPEMLLQAYLKGKKTDPIVKQNDLMLLDSAVHSAGSATPKYEVKGYNSNLLFDLARGEDFPGYVPEFGAQNTSFEMKPGKEKKSGEEASDDEGFGGFRGKRRRRRGGVGGNGGRPEAADIERYQAALADAKAREVRAADLRLFGFTFIWDSDGNGKSIEKIAFDNPALLAQWKALPDDDAADEFVRGRMQMALAKALANPGLRKLKEVLQTPERTFSLSPTETQEIWNAVEDLHAFESFSHGTFALGEKSKLEEAPQLRSLKLAADHFSQAIKADPKGWLAKVDGWQPKETNAFLNFFASRNWFDMASFGSGTAKTETLFKGSPLDPLTSYVAHSEDVDYYRPTGFGQEIDWDTMLEFSGPGKATFYVRGGAETQGKAENPKAATPEALPVPSPRPKATQIIRPNTMAGLLLSNFEPDNARLWSSVLTNNYLGSFQKPAFQSKLVRMVKSDAFADAFRDPAFRARFRDLEFVNIKVRKNPHVPDPPFAPFYPTGDLTVLYVDKGHFDAQTIPREFAKAYEEAIRSQFHGAFDVTISPSTKEEVDALFRLGHLRPIPSQVVTEPAISTGTSVKIVPLQP